MLVWGNIAVRLDGGQGGVLPPWQEWNVARCVAKHKSTRDEISHTYASPT